MVDIEVLPPDATDSANHIKCTNETYLFDGYARILLPGLQVGSELRSVFSFKASVSIKSQIKSLIGNRLSYNLATCICLAV